MRVGILSDIHANLEALDAVLNDAASRDLEGWWLLGDAVGYGGDPEAVLMRLRSLRLLGAVRGNHDKVVAGVEEPDDFAHIARMAALRTRELISGEARMLLASLPQGPIDVSREVAICHGSWSDEDYYLLRKEDFAQAFHELGRPILFFGHTHRAGIYVQFNGTMGELVYETGVPLELPRTARYLINPGSVGQPRDRDARAAYGTFDTESWEMTLLRVPYDIEAAQRKILAAGLPEINAYRLTEGR